MTSKDLRVQLEFDSARINYTMGFFSLSVSDVSLVLRNSFERIIFTKLKHPVQALLRYIKNNEVCYDIKMFLNDV